MSKDYEKRSYTVYITANYKPISVMACSKEEADHIAQEPPVWGEPSDIDVLAIGKFESNPVTTKTRKQENK